MLRMPIVLSILLAAGLASFFFCPPEAVFGAVQIKLAWPDPPDEARIRYMRKFSHSRDVEEKKTGFLEFIAGEDDAIRALGKPYGVAVDKLGRIYVTDTSQKAVQVFDTVKKAYRTLGDEGESAISKSTGVATDGENRVYVADSAASRVFVFDQEGKFLYRFGDEELLGRPTGIAVHDGTGRIYVIDSKKSRIAVFEKEGKHLFTFGTMGDGPENFNTPTNLAIRNDKIYVMDTLNFRVGIFDLEGKHIAHWGSNGRLSGQFSKPKGIGVDSEGHVYVADAAFNNVQIFREDGQLLLSFGEMGPLPGQFWLPAGLYIDQNDKIYVADQYNQRVAVFQYIKSKDPKADEIPPELLKKFGIASGPATAEASAAVATASQGASIK